MLDIIFNPVAHKGKSLQALQTVERILTEKGIPYRVHTTTRAGDGKTLTEAAIANGATDIIAMGGDGTISEVINGFSNFERVNLGIIPCGTGNDFVVSLGVSEDPEEALRHILEGTPSYIDFYELPFGRGINVTGAGLDVDVLRRYNAKKKRNKGTYVRSLLEAVVHHKPYHFTVEMNGKTQTHDCFIVAVGNGACFGGGIYMCPEAKIDDGKLDVVIVKDVKKIGIPGAFIKLMSKKILQFKKTIFERAEEIHVTSDKPIIVNVDGEIYENQDFHVKIVHDKLRVYRLPQKGTE